MSAIRHPLSIAATPHQVWHQLTTNQGLESWLVHQARIEARPGGRVVWIRPDASGTLIEERGMFHDFRPTRRIEIAWDTTSPAPTKGTRVVFQLAMQSGETRLVLVHSGHGFLDEQDARSAEYARWKQALLRLRHVLEGE